MSELMTIGEFSRRCGLSAKMLRSYAEAGLLEPAVVDSSSGYRYYHAGQVVQARLVALLRRAGIAIADIATFVADPSADTLDLWDRGLAAELRARRTCLAQVRRLLGMTAASTTGAVVIDIRPVADLEELSAMFELAGGQFATPIDRTDRRFDDLAARWPEDQALMLVATHDGHRVGGALALRTGEDATLRLMVVLPQYRHRGIGRRLVERVEAEARLMGVRAIAAGTGDDAIGFWHHLGYTPQLLLQWVYNPDLVDDEAQELLAGPLRGQPTARTSYNGIPQLFVELDEPRVDLRETVRAMTNGCHVGFCINKQLVDLSRPATRRN